MTKKIFLHVGCGYSNINNTPFQESEWNEIRLDIDPKKNPDIIGSIVHMNNIKNHSIDALYSSHNIEHLYPHEVEPALREFKRVLNPSTGFAIITCPDIKRICEMISKGRLHESAYESVIGPITPFDILYGNRKSLQKGNLHMAHHCGFTEESLASELTKAHFTDIAIMTRSVPPFDIWSIGTCYNTSKEELKGLADKYFP